MRWWACDWQPQDVALHAGARSPSDGGAVTHGGRFLFRLQGMPDALHGTSGHRGRLLRHGPDIVPSPGFSLECLAITLHGGVYRVASAAIAPSSLVRRGGDAHPG